MVAANLCTTLCSQALFKFYEFQNSVSNRCTDSELCLWSFFWLYASIYVHLLKCTFIFLLLVLSLQYADCPRNCSYFFFLFLFFSSISRNNNSDTANETGKKIDKQSILFILPLLLVVWLKNKYGHIDWHGTFVENRTRDFFYLQLKRVR